MFNKKDYLYTSLFCEENIWKLVDTLYTNQQAKPIEVLFLLNKNNTIALFNQTNAFEDEPVIWDYHVVLSAELNNDRVIFDFDSQCEFPVNIDKYFSKTFTRRESIEDIYQPLIKPINAKYYLQYFSSDRQHMRGLIKQNEFPDYPIIQAAKHVKPLLLNQCRDLNYTIRGQSPSSPEIYLQNTIKSMR